MPTRIHQPRPSHAAPIIYRSEVLSRWAAKSPYEMSIAVADMDHLFLLGGAVQRKHDRAGRDDDEACRLVEARAGDVQRLISVRLAFFEAIQAELLARNRPCQFGRARYDAAAVRRNHRDPGRARVGDDVIVATWLNGCKLSEMVIKVPWHLCFEEAKA